MRVLPLVVALAMLPSCRGTDAVGATPPGAGVQPRPTGEPGVAATKSAAGEPDAGEPVAVAEPMPTPAPLPPPQMVTTLQTPFPPTAIVLEPLQDTTPVVLFPDEASAVRHRVGKILGARGLSLVPVAELERIEAAAAAGRLVLEGDEVCRAPLTAAEVKARYFPQRRFATASAECFDGCRLQVSLMDPTQPDFYDSYRSGKVSRPQDPRAWLTAAGGLRHSDTFGLGGLGLFGTSHSPPVRFNPPVGIGPWAEGQPDSVSFDALEGTVAGCAHPDPFVGLTYEVRASVDRRGHVSRCDATSTHSMAPAGAGACLCRAIETIAFPAGGSGRRVRVQAVDDGGFGSGGRLLLVQPGTEAWVTRLEESPALSRCLASHPIPTALDAQVTLALGLDGTVEDVRIDGDITTVPAMNLSSCLVNELRQVPLPCRPPGVDALRVRLTVNMGP